MTARVAVLAMLVSVLALGAVPAGAATPACPDTIPSAAFTDLAGLDAETVDAIDCLVAYGISKGTSTTTFSPTGDVTRWQMALFLTRQAVEHGVTLPDGADQGFTDLAGFDADTIKAINQLKQLGITQGTSTTTFDPNGIVSRWQMALFITRLVGAAGVTLPSGASQGFTDIGTYDAATQTAINQLVQLGISKGTTTTTYSPATNVARWHMALFLTRTLVADGRVFPGVSLLADVTTQATSGKVKLTVNIGNADNSPAEGQRVEIFAAKDFNTDGTVKTYAVGDSLGGSGVATGSADSMIDLADPVGSAAGQVTVDLTTTNNVAHTTTVVAWIGTNGQAYSSARTQAKITITWTAGAVDYKLTTEDDSTGAKASAGFTNVDSAGMYGDSESFTVQMLGSDGKAVSIAGAKFRVLRYIYVDGLLTAQSSADVVTDANGVYTESHTFTDPGATASEDNVTQADLFVYWDKNGNGNYFDDANNELVAVLVWDDDKAVPTTITLDGPDTADMDGFATMTVEVLDQYGEPCSTGCLVRFDWSNDDVVGFESADQRTIGVDGKASITIGGPGSNLVADNDIVAVRVDASDTTAGWQDPGVDSDTFEVAWYDDAPKKINAPGIVVVETMKASDSFVGEFGAANWKFVYDADDQFAITADGILATNLAAFETALSATDVVDANYDVDGTAPDVSQWNIFTNN